MIYRFGSDQDARLPWLLLKLMATERFTRRWIRWRPQLRDQPQYLGEQISRDSNLGHLEGDVAAVAHDLRADLDQLFL